MITENTTIREFLQVLGTECLRDNLHPNIHVLALFADYKPIAEVDKIYWTNDDFVNDTTTVEGNMEYPNWIITDCRFPNEAQAVVDRKGIVVRIERFTEDTYGWKRHASETSLDNWEFDWTIDNNSTIEELIAEVKVMLQHFGILNKSVINN